MVVSCTFSSAFVGAPSAWDSHGLSDVTSLYVQVKVKGKVFPYSLPSVGPGADPGVQAVSPQVT